MSLFKTCMDIRITEGGRLYTLQRDVEKYFSIKTCFGIKFYDELTYILAERREFS